MPVAWESPPLNGVQDIFSDMTRNALGLGFKDALKDFKGRKIRIATMCSGTEAPILALEMIKNALTHEGFAFDFQHVFSAEVVPYKQAFIERNFHPPILFRDVAEIRVGDMAETAYASKAIPPPPGHVQMLVAGFSCVDFSMLNNQPRTLEILRQPTDRAAGESNSTFMAILRYAVEHQPSVIILENINGAPWNKMAEMFEAIGYAAKFSKVDSKDYYLPQTRQRIYMILINHQTRPDIGLNEACEATVKWEMMLKQLKRPASSPIEAFLLPDESPFLRNAFNRYDRDMKHGLFSVFKSKKTDWGLCKNRHKDYREAHYTGDGHPYTHWDLDQLITPAYVSKPWIITQPMRVLDTLDIIKLSNARADVDIEHKALIFDLSQNVDRNLDRVAPGLTGCITPDGLPYSTLKGRPLHGIEVLSLQGLPIDRLHLMLETSDQLQDMAGNAMTTTVIGAALISAFIAFPKAFLFAETLDDKIDRIDGRDSKSESSRVNFNAHDLPVDVNIVPSWDTLTDPSVFSCCNQKNQQHSFPIDTENQHLGTFDRIATRGQISEQVQKSKEICKTGTSLIEIPKGAQDECTLKSSDFHEAAQDIWMNAKDRFGASKGMTVNELISLAGRTIQRCSCEDNFGMTEVTVYQCKHCLATVCANCKGNPPHHLVPLDLPEPRLPPSNFIEKVFPAFPARLNLNLTREHYVQAIAKCTEVKFSLRQDYLDTISNCFGSDVCLQSFQRCSQWILVYLSKWLRLECRVDGKYAQWLLFARPPIGLPNDHQIRYLLQNPIARLRLAPGVSDIINGQWELFVPCEDKCELTVSGHGMQIKSWRADLGLPEFSTERVWEELCVEKLESTSLSLCQIRKGSNTDLTDEMCISDHGHSSVHESDALTHGMRFNQTAFVGTEMADVTIDNLKAFKPSSSDPMGTSASIGDVRNDHAYAGHPDANKHNNLSNSTCQNISEGIYQLLPQCGTAHRQLHRKRNHSICSDDPVFLYFSVDPYNTDRDRMVISKDHQRRAPGEFHDILGYFESPSNASMIWKPSDALKEQIVFREDWKWVAHSRVQMRSALFNDSLLQLRIKPSLRSSEATNLSISLCGTKFSIIEATVQWVNENPLGTSRPGSWEITEFNQYHMTINVDWLMKVLALSRIMEYCAWQEVPTAIVKPRCLKCAPALPSIRWRLAPPKKSRASSTMIPYEDASEAGPFERAWKMRPSPLTLRFHLKNDDEGIQWASFDVTVDPVALVHRAMIKLPVRSANSNLKAFWRLDIKDRTHETPLCREFRLRPNDDKQAETRHFFRGTSDEYGNEYQLRPEQAKSLSWILRRDGVDSPTFYEQILEESSNRSVKWRMEALISRERQVRGGVLADQVGFGKTVLVIALIQSTLAAAAAEAASSRQNQRIPWSKLFSTKATLVVVPPTLVAQWREEILRFWPRCKVVLLETVEQLKECTISMVETADIVLMSSRMLTHDFAIKRLSRLAALPCPPTSSVNNKPREFQAWLSTALERLNKNMLHLRGNSWTVFEQQLNNQLKDYQGDWVGYNPQLSRRFVGAAFQEHQKALDMKGNVKAAGEGDFANVAPGQNVRGTDFSTIDESSWIVLHAFLFHRVVVDEQTYMSPTDMQIATAIQARSKWLISATPSLTDFIDIQRLSNYLGLFLGTEDYSPSVTKPSNLKAAYKGQTAAERFHALQLSHSARWHDFRSEQAQRFLDEFVRGNVVKHEEIPMIERFVPIHLDAGHQLVYAEFQAHLLVRGSEISKVFCESSLSNDQTYRMKIASGQTNHIESLLQMACYDSWAREEATGGLQIQKQISNARDKLNGNIFTELRAHFNSINACSTAFDDDDGRLKWEAIKQRATTLEPEIQRKVLEAHREHVPRFGRNDAVKQIMSARPEHIDDKAMLKRTIRQMCARAVDWVELSGEATRAVRAFKSLQAAQQTRFTNQPIQFDCCRNPHPCREMVVNAICGHVLCDECATTRKVCGIQKCPIGIQEKGLVRFDELHEPAADASPLSRGLKLDAMSNIIQNVDDDDQVIIFSQFESVTSTIIELLKAQKIPHLNVNAGKSNHTATARAQEAINIFRTRAPIGSYGKFAKVLILNPAESTAAGHNLPNASVIIFISPLFLENKESFNAAYTQAIGRSRRIGQKKTVQVYHLLALDTLDIDIAEEQFNVKFVLQVCKQGQVLKVCSSKQDYDRSPAQWHEKHQKAFLALGSRPYRLAVGSEDIVL